VLLDSSDDDDDDEGCDDGSRSAAQPSGKAAAVGTGEKKMLRKRPAAGALCDSDDYDDDDDDESESESTPQAQAKSQAMNKRDKMEYRVARKRKLRAARELEVERLLASKSWGNPKRRATAAAAAAAVAPRKRNGPLADAFLSGMEQKYASSWGSASVPGGNRRMKRKRKPTR